MRISFLFLVVFPLAAAGGQASAAGRDVLLKKVPHVKQEPGFGGEACAEMYLRQLGQNLNQDHVFDRSGVDPALGRGCTPAELAGALARLGFQVGGGVTEVSAAGAPAAAETHWKALYADLACGVPSITCLRFPGEPKTARHFCLILGYAASGDEVIYHDPEKTQGAYLRLKREVFLKAWLLPDEAAGTVLVRLRLKPGKIEPAKPVASFTRADYARHVRKLKEKVPPGFTIIVQPPFVVLGDEPPTQVKLRAEKTIKWAVDKLKQDYFAKDPKEILDIWLFRDQSSYRKHVRAIFGQEPHTPFGYYSHLHRALIMNIATGGGTLVHELVHPFIDANFPECPAWFNEGLASLYEQCGEQDGHIHGYTNWRLAGLQKAIREGKVPSFKELTAASEQQFYNQDKGTNYGQARYLCYYLQQKGLLVPFYRAFRANCQEDPTGLATLRKILGENDMEAFQKKWGAFVLKLTFP